MSSYPFAFLPIGQPFTVLPIVDSTNNYAMAQIKTASATHGTVYFALQQTAGKGQRGKNWITAPGKNILLSAIIKPFELTPAQQFFLSASVALACYDFLKNYAGKDEIRIKWPNDLYWQDRKAGGILIENVIRTGNEKTAWEWAVAGIGINVNQTQFDKTVNNAVSLKQITGKDYNVVESGKELCTYLEKRYSLLMTGQAKGFIEEYNNILYKQGQSVFLRKNNIIFKTIIQGVSDSGMLITKDTIERQFNFGEVEWVIG